MSRYIDELQLLHAIRLAVVATDADARVTFANEQAATLFGGDLTGRPLFDLLPDSDALPDAGQTFAQVMTGQPWDGDAQVRRLDGSLFLARIATTTLTDDHDRPIGVVALVDDITALRHAEAEADKQRGRLQLALDAAAMGTWHWDLSTGVTHWDEQLEAVFGLPPGGFDGSFETYVGLLHPDDRDFVLAEVQKAMENRSSYVCAHRVVWPDGQVRYVEGLGQVTVGEDGSPTGTIGVCRDVSEAAMAQLANETAAVTRREAEARAQVLHGVMAGFVKAGSVAEVSQVLREQMEQVNELLGGRVSVRFPETGGGGVPMFSTGADDRPVEHADAVLLDTLANQYTIATQLAETLHRTAEISAQLQTSLAASPLPELEGLQIGCHYAPGGDDLEAVGGDWYDAVAAQAGAVSVVVGDVMGRGVEAATTMIRVRAALRALATANPDPAAILGSADAILARDAPEQFVTAVALVVDPRRRVLTMCNAGHVPVLVISPDGDTQVLGDGSGPPLGVTDFIERSVETHALAPGSTVLLTTDGVVESHDVDIDEGIARLRQRARDLRYLPVDQFAAEMAALADPVIRDDVTVVAVRIG